MYTLPHQLFIVGSISRIQNLGQPVKPRLVGIDGPEAGGPQDLSVMVTIPQNRKTLSFLPFTWYLTCSSRFGPHGYPVGFSIFTDLLPVDFYLRLCGTCSALLLSVYFPHLVREADPAVAGSLCMPCKSNFQLYNVYANWKIASRLHTRYAVHCYRLGKVPRTPLKHGDFEVLTGSHVLVSNSFMFLHCPLLQLPPSPRTN